MIIHNLTSETTFEGIYEDWNLFWLWANKSDVRKRETLVYSNRRESVCGYAINSLITLPPN